MSYRHKERTTTGRSLSAMPRSPSEALEPTRAPSRPRGSRTRREARRLGPMLRLVNGLLTFAAVVCVLGGTLTLWVHSELGKPGPLAEAKMFVVPKGTDSRSTAQRLEAEGIIGSQHLFVAHHVGRTIAAYFGGRPSQIKAGEYEVPAQASLRQVAEILGDGRSVLYAFQVTPGRTSYAVVEQIKADANLTGEVGEVPTEGSLLPETYKFQKGMNRRDLVKRAQVEHARLIELLWPKRAPDLPFKTPEEAVVMASIVEKETGRNDERERVAAVFINRLKAGMKLQSDPTILYGLYGGQTPWGKPIYKNEIQSRTAHNTYVIDGLPPTPICNPSRAAIEATLNPAKTNELYFVADGAGGHVFTQTLKDHNAAVTQWRKVEKDVRARQTEAATRAASRTAPPADAPPRTAAGGEAQPESAGATDAAAPAPSEVPLPVRKPKR